MTVSGSDAVHFPGVGKDGVVDKPQLTIGEAGGEITKEDAFIGLLRD